MLKNTNAGRSKIPKFASSSSNPHHAAADSIIPATGPTTTRLRPPVTSYSTITRQHIGQRARTADKEGTLRFVGYVTFAKDVWCGLELDDAAGKNDGSVNGVRYFECSAGHGLMAPLSKVSLVENKAASAECLVDEVSGPPSMLYIDPGSSSSIVTINRNIDQTFKIDANSQTITPKIENIDRTFAIDSVETIDRPSSLPPPRSSLLAGIQPLIPNQLSFSTPFRSDKGGTDVLRSLRFSAIGVLDSQSSNDVDSKRDSLECDDSLGILTPGQIDELPSQFEGYLDAFALDTIEVQSPVEKPNKCLSDHERKLNHNTNDFSLGLINDRILLSNVILLADTTINLDLPLDSVDHSKDFAATRLEQTPSPEELPLDPTPIMEMDPKTDSIKSKSNCFVTSITSITSIDTGYQGDGEMSRPASRGADNSPLTRRPLPRPLPRRAQEPMTDSDFYTESDADNHEDNPLRGDRRAQVIDGTLYGVDPQAAADIYVNNRENMDSSGIFTDLENNPSSRNEDDVDVLQVPDPSPSDTSTKTISENSQNQAQEIIVKSDENPKKRNAPSPGVLSPSSVSSPRHSSLKDDGPSKKYKMPRRDVPSKIKIALEPSVPTSGEKKKKPAGRWDPVMKKISKSEEIKTNLKGVKSKVFENLNVNVSPRPSENNRKVNLKMAANQKVANNKLRRVRSRINSGTPTKMNGNVESSIHSSLSDLSAAHGTLPNKTVGSTKKRNEVVQVTQVLTVNKLTPRTQQQQNSVENKKNAAHYTLGSKSRRNIFSANPEKQATPKEGSRGQVKGGRTSPTVRQTEQQQQPQSRQTNNCQIVGGKAHQPRIAEGLAVLVHHLVFNVGAFDAPILRKRIEKYRFEAEELRLAFRRLEESSAQEQVRFQEAIESERDRCRSNIEQLKEEQRLKIEKVTNQQIELEQRLAAESETSKQKLYQQHEEQLTTLKHEFLKLQKFHEESLEILREENSAISDQIDEKGEELEKMKYESKKLKEDYESREGQLKEQNKELERQIVKLQNKYEERIRKLLEEKRQLREENDRLLGYGDDVGIEDKEVLSLRAVLDLKQTEISDLRKALEKATHQADLYKAAEERARCLNARCEDLELQLLRKSEFEKTLINENFKFQENLKEETNQNRRLSRHNEELRWKLEQNKEVVAKVIEQQSNLSAFTRSPANQNRRLSRPNEELKCKLEPSKEVVAKVIEQQSHLSAFRRSLSERCYSTESSPRPESRKDLDFTLDDLSPPTSPKVKGVVEKSDSVSYLLDLNESPEVVASRIVRRSFRNTTPPKNTPTKSPSNKRPRFRNSCSQSASSSALISPTENETERSHSAPRTFDCDSDSTKYEENMNNCDSSNFGMKLDDTFDVDEDNELNISLLTLPSELDRRSDLQTLPTPKHLAGDCMISESNSEDESTSSSQL